MKKHDAIQALGGTVKTAAAEVGCSGTAIRLWPDELPPRIRDRVQAALWRRHEAAQKLGDTEASVGLRG